MAKYAVYVCGPGDCPSDPEFIHENLMGPVCVPRDFSLTTGRSRKRRQHHFGDRWWWNGGCDAILEGIFVAARVTPRFPRTKGRAIRLEMG